MTQRYTISTVNGMQPDDDGQWVSLEDYNSLFNTCDTWRERYAAMKKRCLVAEAMSLQWTADTPTEPGWYWWRADGIDCAAGGIKWVDVEPGDNGEASVVRPMKGGRQRVLCSFCHDWEWAGPIPEPE